MKLIDKDAVLAEIKRRIQVAFGWMETAPNDVIEAQIELCDDILSFLNTLEVKEVDLEKEIREEYLKRRCYGGRDNMFVILNEPQFNMIAKHFFELGLKAQKGE